MPNWSYTDHEFRAILNRNNDPENEEQSVENTKKELIPHLKMTLVWKNLPEHYFDAMKLAHTFHTLNRVLDSIYDFADDNRIWIDF